MEEERFGEWEMWVLGFGSKSHSREVEDVDVAAETERERIEETRREERDYNY